MYSESKIELRWELASTVPCTAESAAALEACAAIVYGVVSTEKS